MWWPDAIRVPSFLAVGDADSSFSTQGMSVSHGGCDDRKYVQLCADHNPRPRQLAAAACRGLEARSRIISQTSTALLLGHSKERDGASSFQNWACCMNRGGRDV